MGTGRLVASGVAAAGPRSKRRVRRERFLAPALVSPAILLIGLVIAYALIYAFYISFHEVGLRALRGGSAPFVGLQNYRAIVTDSLFWASFRHTLVFVGASVALELILGPAIALAMNQAGVSLAVVTQAVILLPWAVPPVVNGVMWSFLFNSKYGYVNAILLRLGLIGEYVQWGSDPTLAMLVVIIAYVWRTTPFAVLLVHAALRAIPRWTGPAPGSASGTSRSPSWCQRWWSFWSSGQSSRSWSSTRSWPSPTAGPAIPPGWPRGTFTPSPSAT